MAIPVADEDETVGIMIRPTKGLLRWYQGRSADLLRKGISITANKLMVQDLEEGRKKTRKNGGGTK